MPVRLRRGRWRATVAVLLWALIAASADGQEALSRWIRVAEGDLEVLGSADNASVPRVATQMAVARDALRALLSATARIFVPVTVLLKCEATHRSVIVDARRRVYVVGRCGPVSDARHGEVKGRSQLRGNAFQLVRQRAP